MPNELGADGFDEQEEINIGLQKKGHLIELPSWVWKPRSLDSGTLCNECYPS